MRRGTVGIGKWSQSLYLSSCHALSFSNSDLNEIFFILYNRIVVLIETLVLNFKSAAVLVCFLQI